MKTAKLNIDIRITAEYGGEKKAWGTEREIIFTDPGSSVGNVMEQMTPVILRSFTPKFTELVTEAAEYALTGRLRIDPRRN